MKERLRLIRRHFNLTQARLAESLGVSTSAVSNWEADVQEVPVRRLNDISRIYGVDYEWLRTGTGEPFHTKNSATGQTPFEYATNIGCDPIIAKLFESICLMSDSDKKELTRLIKQILNIVNGEQIRQQSRQITDFAQKIISTVNFTEPNSQQNQLPLSSPE